jgi:hypothetical protein
MDPTTSAAVLAVSGCRSPLPAVAAVVSALLEARRHENDIRRIEMATDPKNRPDSEEIVSQSDEDIIGTADEDDDDFDDDDDLVDEEDDTEDAEEA